MFSNQEIGNQLNDELRKVIFEYRKSKNFIVTEKVFNELISYNFPRYKRRLKREVLKKVKKIWTNPKKGINSEQKLDAFLFEFEFPEKRNQETELYGIIDWTEKNNENIKVDMGYSYDFAEGLEQISGIKIPFFNPFVKNKLGKSYYENGILITEDKELAKCFQVKGAIAIHEVFKELYEEKVFDKINVNNDFYFLFGEHDEECYALLKI